MDLEATTNNRKQGFESGSQAGEGTRMPLSLLTDDQILGLLAEQPKMLSVPGVALVLVEFVGTNSAEVAVVATVYAGSEQEISQLPLTVAGLPVIVKVEERRTRRVLEIIDPRRSGGAWPSTNHNR